MPDSSDADLVRRAQEGDVNAVGELYNRHHERIFRYVWLRTGDKPLAEDLTGDTFTRMLKSLPRYRSKGVPFQAWLYRIARNLVVDHFRKTSSRVSVPLDHIEGPGENKNNFNPDVESNLSGVIIREALAKLDPSQRAVVELRFLVGLPLKEVALVLERSVPAIKSLQHRGLKALRMILRQE